MSQRPDTDSAALLAPTLVEAIAQRVAELLRTDLGLTPRLLTPSEVAERFAVSRTWVYEHAAELGAIRLGDGPRARLRFDAKTVAEVLSHEGRRSPEPSETDRRECSTCSVSPPLLPIYGVADGQ
jgi:hypothetical protein